MNAVDYIYMSSDNPHRNASSSDAFPHVKPLFQSQHAKYGQGCVSSNAFSITLFDENDDVLFTRNLTHPFNPQLHPEKQVLPLNGREGFNDSFLMKGRDMLWIFPVATLCVAALIGAYFFCFRRNRPSALLSAVKPPSAQEIQNQQRQQLGYSALS